MSVTKTISSVWQSFISSWQALAEQQGFPEIESDPDWPSPCQFEQNGKTFWQPVEQNSQASFENVEEAIGYKLDSQYKQFFAMYYADNINAQHDNGPLQYLQAWSKADFERLQQNLIGHLLMKQKLKQEPTLFFALTDEEDLNIVVENQTGEIWLEYVGKEPHEKLAESLAEFIAQTQPSFT